MKQSTKKKILVIGTATLTILGWLLGILFIANSVLGFLGSIKEEIASIGIAGPLVFGGTFIAVNTVFFYVGGLSSSFIYAANLLFPLWTAFTIAAISIFLVSLLVFILGEKLGEKAFLWAFSQEDYAKANKVIGSPTIIALALLLPGFPDTLVCFLAGASKMKFRWFALIALVTRTIGVAGICFLGSGVLSVDTWKPVFDTLGLIPTLMIIFSALVSFVALLAMIYILGRRLEKYLEEKHRKMIDDKNARDIIKGEDSSGLL